jgi:glycerol-3-phosphate O-acyltransferase / dihydroxyacetone phosphate acyltransferase
MRTLVIHFFCLCLRIFFRRIEVMDGDLVPDQGPVIYAVNHPNGLVDPLFVLCSSTRPVFFLAKAPILKYPVVGWIARAVGSIPVYRRQDSTAGSNEEMFARAGAVLRGGGAIAIFPEGTTHDDPQLREIKTGAARLAIGAKVGLVRIIPVGIYYTAKHVFRSAALVVFGAPLEVRSDGEADPEKVDRLTAEIDAGLDTVTLQADSHAALSLITRAEDIFTADEDDPLEKEFELRRRFIEGYHYLRTHDPKRLDKLQQAITRFESSLGRAKLDVHELRPRLSAARLFRVLILLPVAAAGAIANYPVYLFIRVLSHRLARGESAVLATIKFLAALAFYPLTWLVLALVAGVRFGWLAGAVTVLGLPFLAYAAVRVFEDIDDIAGDIRGLLYPRKHLLVQRRAILAELFDVAREMEGKGDWQA